MSNQNADHWFKIRATPEEIRRIQRLAAMGGKDASEFIRWLIDQDEQAQATLPKQAGFDFLETTPKKGGEWRYE